MNGIIGRVQLSKNAEMHARTSFFLFLPRSLAMGTEGGGSSGRAKGEGRDVAIFFNEELQGAMHASNKPPFQRREKPVCTHRVFSRVHNSLARVSYNGARISYLFSLLDQSRVMDYYRYLDISFASIREISKNRKKERGTIYWSFKLSWI